MNNEIYHLMASCYLGADVHIVYPKHQLQLEGLDLKLQDLIRSVCRKNYEEQHTTEVTSQVLGTPTEDLNNLQRDIADIKEEKEQERREKNIILYNMSESSNAEEEVQKIADITWQIGLFEDVQLDNDENPKFFRLGNKDSNENMKPRPILIKLVSKYSKIKFLQQWKQLKDMSLWCQSDLTNKQREENKKLVDQLRQRKTNGEDDLIIRKGKIIRRNT